MRGIALTLASVLVLGVVTLSFGVDAVAQSGERLLVGVVQAVTDGDTLTVRVDRTLIKVRLVEIDAPESGQAFGNRSRQSLSDLCFKKSATLTETGVDRYGRTLARVECDGVDANAEQLRRGMAWVFDRYVTHRSLYQIQDDAKAAKRGLWADAHPSPPWEWRDESSSIQTDRAASSSTSTCRIKGNINSRGERIFHSPGQRYYGETQINESMGERWFCSAAEARAAGWRGSRI